MKKKKRKKMIVISIIGIVSIFLLFYAMKPDRSLGRIEGFLKDLVTGIEKMVMYPVYQQQKKKETDQSESYVIQKNMNDTLVKEVDELKKLLDLNQTFTDYQIVNTTVLSRNLSYWFQTLTIDKGKSDGLEEEMIVITKDGLIGKLSKVSNTTSEVKLITANDANYHVSVEIVTDQGNVPGLLNGFDSSDETVLIEGVDSQATIREGQVVLTSGLGGVFPRGIYVGTIQKIEKDKLNLSQRLKVKTKQEFHHIHYVSVLKRSVR